MERNNISIRTYKRKPQIWFGTEADSFSYDFVWHLPIQMYLDGDILRFKREGNIPIFLNHQIVNEEKISFMSTSEKIMKIGQGRKMQNSEGQKSVMQLLIF